MTESAVQRTPVEAWSMILRRAIETPLLPFVDESHIHLSTSILRTNGLFPGSCDAYHECLKVEKTIRTLRLVCRLWASILANSLNRCVLTNLNNINYPGRDIRVLEGAERLQIVLDPLCLCLFSSKAPQCFFSRASSNERDQSWWKDLQDQRTRKLLHQIRIFACVDWITDTKHILGLMPRLQALGLHFSGVRAHAGHLSILPRESYITHLSLQPLTWDDFSTYFTNGYCSLHRLRYLDITFDSTRKNTKLTDTRPSLQYSALQLESLGIHGTLSVNRKYLDPFLSLWGKTVREYVDTCYFHDIQANIIYPSGGAPPLHHFPHLSVYGTPFQAVIMELDIHHRGHLTSTPPQSRSLCSFVLKIPNYSYKPPYDSEEAAFRFTTYIEEWRFVEVVIDKTWASLYAFFGLHKLSENARWYKAFFRTLLKANLNVLDQNFTPIGDERHKELWEESIN